VFFFSFTYTNLCDFRNGKSPQQQQSQTSQDSNPFDNEDEEWEDDSALKDNGEPGVPVKALYDYEGAESDELTFKIGMYVQYTI